MFHQLTIHNLSHYFGNQSQTVCFEDFSATMHPGDRVAIIGPNGSGKSTLLKILNQEINPHHGEILGLEHIQRAYVPQTVDNFEDLSGSQRFQKALSQAISKQPDMLLLDEPTNHLDTKNRQSLKRMLKHFYGILIVATHDPDLIRSSTDIIWHIDNGRVNVFRGNYDEYMKIKETEYHKLTQELAELQREKKQTHQDLMREQQRYKKSKAYGKKRYDGDKLTLSGKKRQGITTTTKKQKEISSSKQDIVDKIQSINLPEMIKPTFHIAHESKTKECIIQVSQGGCGYENNMVLENISFNLSSHKKVAMQGENASGKSTFIKALLNKSEVDKSGFWQACHSDKIGYLDQHYHNINPKLTVLENVLSVQPDWSPADVHRHLNDFLFKSYDSVNKIASVLSGGEKCRLSLAMIAAKTPAVLILDEITNNLDLDTKAYVVQVLNEYPGAMIVISHEDHFLAQLQLDTEYMIKNKKLTCN